MRKIYYIYQIITALLLLPQLLLATPKLTVIVTVDGLSESNLQNLRPYWPQGGLRTLSEEAFQATLTFPHQIYGGGESTATLMTGLTPRQHGYAMDGYFSRTDRKIHTLLHDDQEKGIGTTDRISARSLLGTTITDNWRIQFGSKAHIYAIGVHATQTILLAGHAADACCWIDAKNQRWASTSYYSEGLPSSADQFNVKGRFNELITRTWTPRMDISMYLCPTPEEKKKGFNYESSRFLMSSPVANTLVIELALAIQKAEKMGEDTTPDLLLLNLHTSTPNSHSDQISTAEQEDLYLWLNQDLGYMMEQLSRRIGHNNYELMLIGVPAKGTNSETFKAAGIPQRQFNVDRAAALTGTYLMALYGHERWVDGGYGNAIFLNRNLIEQKRLSLETIQRQVANFLMEFEGIELALPTHEALCHPMMMNSISKRTMGDVTFILEPSWTLMENDKVQLDCVIDNEPTAPLMHWSGTLRQWPKENLDATQIKKLLAQ